MSEYRMVKTFTMANWILFVVGFGIVVVFSHSPLVIFGAWLASLHLSVSAEGTRWPR